MDTIDNLSVKGTFDGKISGTNAESFITLIKSPIQANAVQFEKKSYLDNAMKMEETYLKDISLCEQEATISFWITIITSTYDGPMVSIQGNSMY